MHQNSGEATKTVIRGKSIALSFMLKMKKGLRSIIKGLGAVVQSTRQWGVDAGFQEGQWDNQTCTGNVQAAGLGCK